jgi:uncharacterized cupredoxin-like copper-binding protein
MKTRLAALGILLSSVALFSPLPAGAEEAASVNVALLDMSSLMGPGNGGNFSMMGNGWGMMGGWGSGWGAGNWGMMGDGRGMMGMGHMAVRVDQASIKAGAVHFNVTNWSRGVVHEMLVVAVDSADAPLPYDYNTAKVPENQVKSMGEVGELQPNQSGSLDVTLAAGTYLLVCNVPGHYAAGMWVPLTVTP